MSGEFSWASSTRIACQGFLCSASLASRVAGSGQEREVEVEVEREEEEEEAASASASSSSSPSQTLTFTLTQTPATNASMNCDQKLFARLGSARFLSRNR